MTTPASELDFEETMTIGGPVELGALLRWRDESKACECNGFVEWASADTAIVVVKYYWHDGIWPAAEKSTGEEKRIRLVWA